MKKRIGETRRNRQGLLMMIVDYKNRKQITVEFLANGERCETTYYAFRKGLPTANLMERPSHTECSFTQAVWISIGILSLLILAISGLTYWILK